jgi:hypothetical protein
MTLYYWEPGMAFCGIYTSDHGDECVEYGQLSAEQAKRAIPLEVDDVFGIVESLEEYEEATKNDPETDN